MALNHIKDLPELNSKDMKVLAELRANNLQQFHTNVTSFFLDEMYDYIDSGRVWRVSIMGPTRQGKSEIGSSIGFLYIKRFNINIVKCTYLKDDNINEMVEAGEITLKRLDFTVKNNMYGSEEEYLKTIKELAKENKLLFGQISQIDEDRKKAGGLGSSTQRMEFANINNIVAKFNQSEIYITPDHLITRNAPYGLVAHKKDTVNRVNWSLLYKIEMMPSGIHEFKFLGWVCMPLHPYKLFRSEYNKLKNEWIKDELVGKIDERSKSRNDVAEYLAKSKIFEMNETGKKFIYSKGERLAYIDDLIVKGEIPSFNELEKSRIMDSATLKAKLDGIDG